MEPEHTEILFLVGFFLLVWAIAVAGVRVAGLVSYQGTQADREAALLGHHQGNRL